jgi:hypothetical protein
MESLLFCRVFHQGKELDWQDTFEMPATFGKDNRSLPPAIIARNGAGKRKTPSGHRARLGVFADDLITSMNEFA